MCEEKVQDLASCPISSGSQHSQKFWTASDAPTANHHEHTQPISRETTRSIHKISTSPAKEHQWDSFPASSPHIIDSARKNVTPPQIPRLTLPWSQIAQITTTTRGGIPSIGATQALPHTHVVVCNGQSCTNQVTTNTRRQFIRDPVKTQTNISHAQHFLQHTLPSRQEEQQPFPRLKIQRDRRIGDRCYAK